MAQIKTYGSGIKTEAQKIAEAERKKEKRQKEDAERRVSLDAATSADIQKEAAKIVLEKARTTAPPDPAVLEKHAEEKKAQREADEALYEEIMLECDKARKNYYRFATAANNAALKFSPLSQEMSRVCSRLGRTNPITDGVMHVGEPTGVIMDDVRHTEAVWAMFTKRFRAIGRVSAEDFESPVGV